MGMLRSRCWAAASGAILPRKVRAPRNAVPGNARRLWFRRNPGPGSGTVPQRTDRRWLRTKAIWQQRTGKGETVRQERTARWATKAARQTPPGARPNRDGAHVSACRAGTGPVIRVGCWRRRATAVREEWSPRGFTPLDRTRLIDGVIASQPGQVATRSVATGLGQDRPASENGGPQAAIFDSSDGVAPPRSSFCTFLETPSGLGGSAAGRARRVQITPPTPLNPIAALPPPHRARTDTAAPAPPARAGRRARHRGPAAAAHHRAPR